MSALDGATFFAAVRTSLFSGALTQRQVDGMNAILAAWADSGYSDDRWLAYDLATAYHETAKAMYPIEEFGKGKGHPYGVPGPDGQIAYGRGFVQLTWAVNYEKADKALGLNGALVKNYALALEPATAAKILVKGMAEGWFTAFKLSDYLNDTTGDFVNARKVVNGLDHAADIAGYALKFQTAIASARHRGADTSPVVATPAVPAVDPVGDLFGQIASTIGGALGGLFQSTSSTAAPPVAAPASAAPQLELSTVLKLAEFFLANVSSFASYASVLPHVVAEIPDIVDKGTKMVAAFEQLVTDVKAGKIGNAPNDFQALFAAIEAILSDIGVPLSTITGVVAMMPSLPNVDGIAAIPNPAAK